MVAMTSRAAPKSLGGTTFAQPLFAVFRHMVAPILEGSGLMEHGKASSNGRDRTGDDRRDLKKCGKFAAVTPPAITMLLSTSLTSNAIAKSGGNKTGWVGGGPGKSTVRGNKK